MEFDFSHSHIWIGSEERKECGKYLCFQTIALILFSKIKFRISECFGAWSRQSAV